MSKSPRQILDEGITCLREASIEEAEIDAWYLFEEAFSIKRAEFYMNQRLQVDEKIFQDKYPAYLEMLKTRSKHVPLQHIIGTQEFMGLNFFVNRHVLIPRQDTEILVEEVLKDNPLPNIKLLDMCTGSGCIAISLKKLGKYREVWAADISNEALAVAGKNAGEAGCDIKMIQGDLFAPCKKERFDIIVSNPPYIPTEEIETLMPEVKDFEPRLALDGALDGLLFYRRLAIESKEHLNSFGKVYFEIGYHQGLEVSDLLRHEGFEKVTIIKDHAGLDRVVKAVLPY